MLSKSFSSNKSHLRFLKKILLKKYLGSFDKLNYILEVKFCEPKQWPMLNKFNLLFRKKIKLKNKITV